MKKIFILIGLLMIVTACQKQVTNFDECVAAGNPVMESYPAQCRHGDQTFVEEIDSESVSGDGPDVPPLPEVGVCTKEEKAAEMCTLEYAPVCGDNSKTYGNKCTACASKEIDIYTEGECSSFEMETQCVDFGGKWIHEYAECEYISKDSCIVMGGEFYPCESACRNDPDAEICTQQCVPVCKFLI